MLTLERSFILSFARCNLLHCRRNGTRTTTIWASRKDAEVENSQRGEALFPLRFSKSVLARTAIAVSALGFIDAGYSGDWSRIGVISKETEELLKLAAYIVAPLCLFLILSIPGDDKASQDN